MQGIRRCRDEGLGYAVAEEENEKEKQKGKKKEKTRREKKEQEKKAKTTRQRQITFQEQTALLNQINYEADQNELKVEVPIGIECIFGAFFFSSTKAHSPFTWTLGITTLLQAKGTSKQRFVFCFCFFFYCVCPHKLPFFIHRFQTSTRSVQRGQTQITFTFFYSFISFC